MQETDFLDKITAALDSALHKRDEYTHSHSSRVVTVASELGEKLNLSPAELKVLKICARFHDIGKIGKIKGDAHKSFRVNRAKKSEVTPPQCVHISEMCHAPDFTVVSYFKKKCFSHPSGSR
jgi:HD superfamily phosphodiesterase